MYFMSHVGHFSWYIPDLSYLLVVLSCLVVRSFSMVLFVVSAILMFDSLNILVINLVSLPMWVNLAHLGSFCILFLEVYFFLLFLVIMHEVGIVFVVR